jgi:peptidoglycan hydrolase CwlO-like protein
MIVDFLLYQYFLGIIFDLSVNKDTVVALITLSGVILSVFYSKKAQNNAYQANRAVNCRMPGEPTIWEMVRETKQDVKEIQKEVRGLTSWKEGYKDGPLDSGHKVEEFVNNMKNLQDCVGGFDTKINDLNKQIKKYGCPVRQKEALECLKNEIKDV